MWVKQTTLGTCPHPDPSLILMDEPTWSQHGLQHGSTALWSLHLWRQHCGPWAPCAKAIPPRKHLGAPGESRHLEKPINADLEPSFPCEKPINADLPQWRCFCLLSTLQSHPTDHPPRLPRSPGCCGGESTTPRLGGGTGWVRLRLTVKIEGSTYLYI